MESKIKKISDLITSYSDTLQLFEEHKVLDIYNSWEQIVGEKIAPHSRLVDINQNTAIIETDHTGWCQQILLQKKKIIWNFQKKYTELEIHNIAVVVSAYYKEKETKPVHITNNQEEESSISVPPLSKNIPGELTKLLKDLRDSIIIHEK